MARIINLTHEKGCAMMEFVAKAAAANMLAQQMDIPLMEAKKHIEAIFKEKGIQVVNYMAESDLPRESDIPEGMIPIIEMDDLTKEKTISFVSKEELHKSKVV